MVLGLIFFHKRIIHFKARGSLRYMWLCTLSLWVSTWGLHLHEEGNPGNNNNKNTTNNNNKQCPFVKNYLLPFGSPLLSLQKTSSFTSQELEFSFLPCSLSLSEPPAPLYPHQFHRMLFQSISFLCQQLHLCISLSYPAKSNFESLHHSVFMYLCLDVQQFL